jgi:hypothetical protein
MTRRKARHIDWRQQFRQLDRYMDGAGGIVNVRYRGTNCGVMAFLETLTATFESRGESSALQKSVGVSIRLDPDNYKVRYLAGIRGEFERKLEKPLRIEKRASFSFRLEGKILTENKVGGNMNVENILNVDSDPLMAAERNDWVSALIEALRDHLKTKRFMIVLTSGSTNEQREFWSCLWNMASELLQEGLLLVRMTDESDAHATDHLDMYPSDCSVTLSAELTDNAVNHAIDDIARIILEHVPDKNEHSARDLAKGYVLGRKDNVSALHNGLMAFTLDLKDYDE